MKCQSWVFWEKYKKYCKMLPLEFAHRVVKVKMQNFSNAECYFDFLLLSYWIIVFIQYLP